MKPYSLQIVIPAAVIVFCSALGGYFSYQHYGKAKAMIEKDGKSIVSLIMNTVQTDVNSGLPQKMLQQRMADVPPQVDAFFIVDDQDDILLAGRPESVARAAHFDPATARLAQMRKITMIDPAGNFISAYYPVTLNQTGKKAVAAIAFLEYDLSRPLSEERISALETAFFAALAAFLFALSLFALIRYRLGSRIGALAEAAASIAAGKSRRSGVTGADEIGGFAAHFDFMAEKIEAKMMELMLREKRVAGILERLPVAVLVCGEDSGIGYRNRMAVEFFGREDAVFDSSWKFLAEDGSTLIDAAHPARRAIGEGEEIMNATLGFRRPEDAAPSWALVNAYPEIGADGKPSGAVFSFADISPIKKSEAALSIRVAILEEKEHEFEALKNDFDNFSYAISHDLRAPLRAVDGFSQLLSDEHTEAIDNEGLRMIEVLRQNTRKMAELIDGLLVYARIARKEADRAEIDMSSLASEVIDELKRDALDRKVNISLSPLEPAVGDRALIRLLFRNLLDNALKFTLKREIAAIEVGSRREANETVYFVKDNGCGFDMNDAKKLFSLFERLPGAEEFPGNGAGLAIAKRIVERHGGRIWAEGRVDDGAIFFFALAGGKRER